jgi:hypothetical protein
MANFGVHFAGAVVGGLGCGLIGLLVRGVENPWFGGACGLLAVVGALLPDIDHDDAIPNREIFGVLAAALPAGLLGWLAREWRWTTEQNICFFGLSYVLIRYGVAPVFKKITVHRGIIHSIPFALLAGQLVALSLFRFTVLERMLAGASLTVGFFVHLALDELFAVDFLGRSLKRSFGTAIKLRSKDWGPTLAVYAGLGLCSLLFVWQFGTQALRALKRVGVL